jgi:hypothetical protein
MPQKHDTGWWGFDRWFSIGAFIASVIISIILVPEARTYVDNMAGTYGRGLVFTLIYAALFVGVGLAIWRTHTMNEYANRIQDLQKAIAVSEQAQRDIESSLAQTKDERDTVQQKLDAITKKDKRGRWSTIKCITYGHLEYEPFIRYDQKDPSGLGVKLLENLLNFLPKDSICPHFPKKDWSDVLEGLKQGDYDVVATPLFATFERSVEVAFTAPLFFSNVGLYVREGIAGSEMFKGLTADNLITTLASSPMKLTFLCVKGEISQKLGERYARETNSDFKLLGSGVSPKSMLDFIDKQDHSEKPYALFCESFYADSKLPVTSGRVSRVLPYHQILYPVCYAVRIGDYHLKNLLNLRLLDLRSGPDNGADEANESVPPSQGTFELLCDELRADAARRGRTLTDVEICNHFVASWPQTAKAARKEVAHA